MQYLRKHRVGRHIWKIGAASLIALSLAGAACRAQGAATSQPAETPWSRDMKKYPGLLEEFGHVMEKLQNVSFPGPRTESRLLASLPASTVAYGSFSNYGGVAHEALKVFRERLKESAVLRDWWEHGESTKSAPKVLETLEQIDQLMQFFGDEIVVSVSVQEKKPRLLMLAELRKHGLKPFVQGMITRLADAKKPGVRVLDLQELAAEKEGGPEETLLVVERSDYAVASLDVATLREFNSRLETKRSDFTATPFGQRAAQEYRSGLTLLSGVNLQHLVSLLSPEDRLNPTFQQTGFADVKYYIWEHKSVAGRTLSQSELSFTGPRHGSAAWLSNSRPVKSLEFVSPKAMFALTLNLKSPALLFADIQELARIGGSNPFANLAQMERSLGLNLQNDVLGTLTGELTVELDRITQPLPVMRVLLGVKDAEHLQKTLTTLLASANMAVERKDQDGVTFHLLHFPANPPVEIAYAFVDGYWVLASNRDTLAEAIQQHQSGASLAKSARFHAALPPGQSVDASAIYFQDATALAALQLQRFAPELAEAMAQGQAAEVEPVVLKVTGDDTMLRAASTNPGFDTGTILIVAAIAIPNLLRARIAANEASAVGSIRTVNVVQVQYEALYPQRGFAPNLATLGPTAPGTTPSPDHADLLDPVLAAPSCTGEAWCTKNGYNIRVTATCRLKKCTEYVVVAVPVTHGTTGTRSFCSTSDGIIRVTAEPVLQPALTPADCKKWSPIT